MTPQRRGIRWPLRLGDKSSVRGLWTVVLLVGAAECSEAATIQAAPLNLPSRIAAARPGDTVKLAPGRYPNLTISGRAFSPALVIEAKDATIIEAQLAGTRGVTIRGGVLYQARITLPSRVQTGTYTAETFAVSQGRVVASAVAEVEVKKVGFERFVEVFAQSQSFLYGLLAVSLSIAMGWIAGRLFALI